VIIPVEFFLYLLRGMRQVRYVDMCMCICLWYIVTVHLLRTTIMIISAVDFYCKTI